MNGLRDSRALPIGSIVVLSCGLYLGSYKVPPKKELPRWMMKILRYLKDPKLWELWYIPYSG